MALYGPSGTRYETGQWYQRTIRWAEVVVYAITTDPRDIAIGAIWRSDNASDLRRHILTSIQTGEAFNSYLITFMVEPFMESTYTFTNSTNEAAAATTLEDIQEAQRRIDAIVGRPAYLSPNGTVGLNSDNSSSYLGNIIERSRDNSWVSVISTPAYLPNPLFDMWEEAKQSEEKPKVEEERSCRRLFNNMDIEGEL